MFKIIEKSICPLTGKTELKYTFQLYDGNVKTFETSFNDEKAANMKINEMFRDYLLFTYNHFLMDTHKYWDSSFIAEKDEIRLKAFAKLKEANITMQTKILPNVAQIIIKLEALLTYVLPPETDERFNFLYSIKNELINFSRQIKTS